MLVVGCRGAEGLRSIIQRQFVGVWVAHAWCDGARVATCCGIQCRYSTSVAIASAIGGVALSSSNGHFGALSCSLCLGPRARLCFLFRLVLLCSDTCCIVVPARSAAWFVVTPPLPVRYPSRCCTGPLCSPYAAVPLLLGLFDGVEWLVRPRVATLGV